MTDAQGAVSGSVTRADAFRVVDLERALQQQLQSFRLAGLAHEIDGAEFRLKAAQIENRIGDELARTMKCNVSAAIDLEEVDASFV